MLCVMELYHPKQHIIFLSYTSIKKLRIYRKVLLSNITKKITLCQRKVPIFMTWKNEKGRFASQFNNFLICYLTNMTVIASHNYNVDICHYSIDILNFDKSCISLLLQRDSDLSLSMTLLVYNLSCFIVIQLRHYVMFVCLCFLQIYKTTRISL